MQLSKRFTIVLTATLLVFGFSESRAQIVYGQPASGKLRLVYTHWNTEDDSGSADVNQLAIPLNAFFPLSNDFELRFHAADVSSKVAIDSGDSKLSGLGDLRLQLNRSLADDRLLLSLGLNLPTGKQKLNSGRELVVMNYLSENYLSFPVRRLGEGFGFNLLLGGAVSRGSSRLGATAMFQYSGAYEPFEGRGDYDPGESFSLSATADTRTGGSLLSAGLSVTFFAVDKIDEAKFRKSSTQFDLWTGVDIPGQKVSGSGGIHLLLRGRQTAYDLDEEIFEQLRLYGNELTLSGALSYHPAQKWSVTPSLQLRIIGGNEYSDYRRQDGGTIFGIGSDFARALGERLDARLGLQYFTGNADGGDISLSGYQLTAGLAAEF